jgi:regulator of protease activity HflC (stomatin/prohibitin superfamily)
MNDLIQIYDNNTGETITREMTDEEQAERNAQVAAYEAEQQAKAAEAEAKGTQKAALLDRLGITEDEAKLLLA